MFLKQQAMPAQLARPTALGNGRPSTKRFGIYYTPEYIVRFIVQNTLGRLCAGKSPAQVGHIRVLDPACGTGAFLLGAYQYLMEWYRAWYVQDGPDKHRERICRGKNGQWRLTPAEKRRILVDSIHGVDIDSEAVEIARLSLRDLDLKSSTQAASNIKHGNALLGIDFSAQDRKHPAPPFDWPAEFPEAMQAGGFDVVIGNPPYGATLSDGERDYLARKFPVATTDTAALLMMQAHRLTRTGGWNGFIVPKPFTYSSNWQQLRALFLKELRVLADTGKAWREVKLEQVVYTLQKGEPSTHYLSLTRNDKEFVAVGLMSKKTCATFGFYLNGVNSGELSLARKLQSVGTFLSDFTTNVRGAMLQGRLSGQGGLRAIGGKQVRPFHVQGQKGFLPRNAELPVQALVKPGSILVQNIVAHSAHPVEHIQIIGSVITDHEAEKLAILDTVNQLSNHSHLSSYYLLALLSSRLVNWYVYRFIFARAIRTLHFDGPVSRRIPIPNLNLKKPTARIGHARLVALAKKLAVLPRREAACKARGEKARLQPQIQCLRQKIDRCVYQLYGLTPEEIIVVNGGDPGAAPSAKDER